MKKRILVVDDDPQLLEITREFLELDGYLVKTLGGPFGTAAAVMSFHPDLILLDVNMPGLSGDQLAAIVLGDRPEAPRKVAFYSSNDEDSLRRLARQAGAVGYICKGDGASLRRRVKELLER